MVIKNSFSCLGEFLSCSSTTVLIKKIARKEKHYVLSTQIIKPKKINGYIVNLEN